MNKKELIEFVGKSKRIMSGTKSTHLRYIRDGNYRKIYLVNEEEQEIKLLARVKRAKCYNKSFLNNLARRNK